MNILHFHLAHHPLLHLSFCLALSVFNNSLNPALFFLVFLSPFFLTNPLLLIYCSNSTLGPFRLHNLASLFQVSVSFSLHSYKHRNILNSPISYPTDVYISSPLQCWHIIVKLYEQAIFYIHT